jgi:hypothetical protein
VAFRGRELAPGGRLVVLTLGADEDGQLGFGPLLEAMVDTLAELVAEAVIGTEEHVRMAIPVVGRTGKDFESPFAPKGTFEKMSITHMELFDAEDRFWKQYQRDGKADAFGKQWAAFLRNALFPALVAALDQQRSVERFFDRLESGIATRLAAAPERIRIPLALLMIEKRNRTED